MNLDVVSPPQFIFSPWKSPRDGTPQENLGQVPKDPLPKLPSPDHIPIRPVCIRSPMLPYTKPPTPPPVEEVPISQISPNPILHFASMNDQEQRNALERHRRMTDLCQRIIIIFLFLNAIHLSVYIYAFMSYRPPLQEDNPHNYPALFILIHRSIHLFVDISVVMRIRRFDQKAVELARFSSKALLLFSGVVMMTTETILILWTLHRARLADRLLEGIIAMLGFSLLTSIAWLALTMPFNRLLYELHVSRNVNAKLEAAQKI